MSGRIHYRKGYKYQLDRPYELDLCAYGWTGRRAVAGNVFVCIVRGGVLRIREAYAWNGASGPTIDTPSTLRASLVHDALYQLIRIGALEPEHQRFADDLFHCLLREDGMGAIRAAYFHRAVRLLGHRACRPSVEPREMLSPEPRAILGSPCQ